MATKKAAKTRILEVKRGRGMVFWAQMSVPYESSRRFSEITADFSPLVEKQVISGFYIDAVVASAFDDATAGSKKHFTPVCLSSQFRQYLMAGAPLGFSFSPAAVTSAELCATDKKPVCSVSISYGEPVQSHADLKSLGGMQGMMEHSFTKEELEEFGRMTGAILGARHLAPMLAHSYFSGTVAMAVSTYYTRAEPAACQRKIGPFPEWDHELMAPLEDEPAEPNSIHSICAMAEECFNDGGIVYTSHTATFFKGAYQLMPSELFKMCVDYSSLKTVPSKDGKGIAGVRGPVKGLAMLENGEKIFECSAGIMARKAG